MATWHTSNCSTLGAGAVGCYLYYGPGLTNPVSDGYYSDGNYCYTVTGGSGYISSAAACSYTVYINGDLSPNIADYSGYFSIILFSSTNLYAGGAVAVNTNVTVTVYAYDDFSNYGTTSVTISNGNICAYSSIGGFFSGAYVSDWGPTTTPSPSAFGNQSYTNGYFTINSATPC